jgi:hypothetical protein
MALTLTTQPTGSAESGASNVASFVQTDFVDAANQVTGRLSVFSVAPADASGLPPYLQMRLELT